MLVGRLLPIAVLAMGVIIAAGIFVDISSSEMSRVPVIDLDATFETPPSPATPPASPPVEVVPPPVEVLPLPTEVVPPPPIDGGGGTPIDPDDDGAGDQQDSDGDGDG